MMMILGNVAQFSECFGVHFCSVSVMFTIAETNGVGRKFVFPGLQFAILAQGFAWRTVCTWHIARDTVRLLAHHVVLRPRVGRCGPVAAHPHGSHQLPQPTDFAKIRVRKAQGN